MLFTSFPHVLYQISNTRFASRPLPSQLENNYDSLYVQCAWTTSRTTRCLGNSVVSCHAVGYKGSTDKNDVLTFLFLLPTPLI